MFHGERFVSMEATSWTRNWHWREKFPNTDLKYIICTGPSPTCPSNWKFVATALISVFSPNTGNKDQKKLLIRALFTQVMFWSFLLFPYDELTLYLLSNCLDFPAKVPHNSNANVSKGILMLKLIKEQFYKENTIHVANLWLANLADECLLFIISSKWYHAFITWNGTFSGPYSSRFPHFRAINF